MDVMRVDSAELQFLSLDKEIYLVLEDAHNPRGLSIRLTPKAVLKLMKTGPRAVAEFLNAHSLSYTDINVSSK